MCKHWHLVAICCTARPNFRAHHSLRFYPLFSDDSLLSPSFSLLRSSPSYFHLFLLPLPVLPFFLFSRSNPPSSIPFSLLVSFHSHYSRLLIPSSLSSIILSSSPLPSNPFLTFSFLCLFPLLLIPFFPSSSFPCLSLFFSFLRHPLLSPLSFILPFCFSLLHPFPPLPPPFLPPLPPLCFCFSCLFVCLSERRKMMTSPISSVAPPPSAVAPHLGNQGRPWESSAPHNCPRVNWGVIMSPCPPSTMAVSLSVSLSLPLLSFDHQTARKLWSKKRDVWNEKMWSKSGDPSFKTSSLKACLWRKLEL